MAGRVERVRSSPPPGGFTWSKWLGRDWQIGFAFVAPVVILMLLLIAWPFIRAIYISMTARSIAREVRFVGLENYIRLLDDPFYRQAVWNTFEFTAGAIFFKFVFGMLAAILLNGLTRGRNIITGLVLLPWIVPSVVQALSWRSIYDPLFGGLNPILMNLGLIDQPQAWIADPALAMPAVIAVNVWAGIPFFTVNFVAGMQAIDKDLYEAAEMDGANAWDKFIYITLPSLRYVILVTTLLSTIWTFNNFETIWLLTQGGPAGTTKVYSLLAYEKAIRGLRFGPGTAVAFSLTPILLFFILLLSRYMRREVVMDDEDTWQDRMMAGIGWVLGWIARIVSYPFALLWQGVKSVLPARRGRRSRRRTQTQQEILRAIALIFLLAFILFPLYWILITGFKGDAQIGQRTSIFWPDPWTTEQFTELYYDTNFMIWLRNSVIVSISTTALAVVIAALSGYALARLRFRGADSMTTALLVTYLLPAALMFIPLYRILSELRIINTLWALILTYPTSVVPFATWLLMGYYRSIPEEMEEAALVDGCNRLQAFLRVTLPLTLPALAAVTLFSFTAAWKEFLFAFVFINSNDLYTLPVGLAQTIYGDIYPWGLLMAASLLISVPVVILYMWGQRFMIAGLTAGSVKG